MNQLEHQLETYSKTTLGFWIYLMTDCILFAVLFTSYAVLRDSVFGGPFSRELFSLSTSFAETIILLCSSVTCGFAMLSTRRHGANRVVGWLAVTWVLGAIFLALELHEFTHLVQEGNSWRKSAFLSAFFTLVGTHGLHVTVGLLWMMVMMAQLIVCGITLDTFRRLVLLSLFWHFLDLIWIFIFTFVYLMGVI